MIAPQNDNRPPARPYSTAEDYVSAVREEGRKAGIKKGYLSGLDRAYSIASMLGSRSDWTPEQKLAAALISAAIAAASEMERAHAR